MGQKFERWTVINSELIYRNRSSCREACILARCDCGMERLVSASRLITGYTHGCRRCVHGELSTHPSWKGCGQIPARYVSKLKINAQKRNILFNLTIEYLAFLFESQEGKCALSGVPIQLSYSKKFKSIDRASLDRINNDVGYVEGNVQFVSVKINYAKHKMNQEDFIDMCKKVAALYGERP